jgi:ectoine hydroxylase
LTRNRVRPDDVYPSRVGGRSCVLPRKDPVLHASPASHAPGPLLPSERVRFEREGFLHMERLYPPAEVQDVLADLLREVDRRRSDDAPELIREPDGDQIRSIFDVHRRHPALARMAADRRLVGIAEQILGSAVYIHQSRVNFKPGFEGKEFYWHSDFETWHVEDGMPRMRAVSISLNLTPNLAVNGPLMVIPASHRYFVSCSGTTPEAHHLASLRRQEHGVPDPEVLTWLAERSGVQAPTGQAGSALVFDCNVMHGSGGNITPYPRSNVFFVYNSLENTLVEPFCGHPPRPDHVASRDFTPIGRS